MEYRLNPAAEKNSGLTAEKINKTAAKLGNKAKRLLYTFSILLGMLNQAEVSWAQEKFNAAENPDHKVSAVAAEARPFNTDSLRTKETITAEDLQQACETVSPPIDFNKNPLTAEEVAHAGNLIKKFGFEKIVALLLSDLEQDRGQHQIEIDPAFEKSMSSEDAEKFRGWFEAEPAQG